MMRLKMKRMTTWRVSVAACNQQSPPLSSSSRIQPSSGMNEIACHDYQRSQIVRGLRETLHQDGGKALGLRGKARCCETAPYNSISRIGSQDASTEREYCLNKHSRTRVHRDIYEHVDTKEISRLGNRGTGGQARPQHYRSPSYRTEARHAVAEPTAAANRKTPKKTPQCAMIFLVERTYHGREMPEPNLHAKTNIFGQQSDDDLSTGSLHYIYKERQRASLFYVDTPWIQE